MRFLPKPRVFLWLMPVLALVAAMIFWQLKPEQSPEVNSGPKFSTPEPEPDRTSGENSAEIPLSQAPPPATTGDPEPWESPTRTQLAERLEDFFGQASEGKARIPFTADELADPKLQRKLFDLNYQLGAAADSGVDLRNLEAYGIVVNPDRTISIDLDAYPRWRNSGSILYFLSDEEHQERLLNTLRERGFSETEIQEVKERASREFGKTRRQMMQQHIREFMNDLKTGSLSSQEELRRAYLFDYQSSQDFRWPTIQRGLDILAPLDSAKREILIQVARQGVSSRTTITPTERSVSAQRAISLAKSGELLRMYTPSQEEKKP